jgi:hypothetical protein
MGSNYTISGSNVYYGYDCSGFVYNMTKATGLYDGTSFSAGNFATVSAPYGWHTVSVNTADSSELIEGDILENSHHIVIYAGEGKIVHAWGHNNKTCEESILISDYYNDGWVVSRYGSD